MSTYESKNSQGRGNNWLRSSNTEAGSLLISEIKSRLNNEQPKLVLELDIVLESIYKHKAAFLAVDILSANGCGLMQAIPQLECFIKDDNKQHLINVSIQLPPLIPGQYLVGIWVGSHNTETLDEVKEAIVFEIDDSPTPGRSFPHHTEHGYVVPVSVLRCI